MVVQPIGASVCGQEFTVASGKTVTCVREAHDDKIKHSSRKTNKPSVLPTVALATLEDVPETDVVTVTETTRDEHQTLVDAQVMDAHTKWVAAGKPKEFNKSPRKRYYLAPDEVDGARAMLRRAETLHGVRVRIAPAKHHACADHPEDGCPFAGKVMLYWTAVDRNPRKDKTTTV